MQIGTRITAEQYTPSEAEHVTGVSPALQRDWRRRSLLPDSEKYQARYSASALAEMLLMKDFADHGFGPKLLRDLLGMSALPLGDWVSILSAGHTVEIDASQLPSRYVLFSDDEAFRTNDLNNAFDVLASRNHRLGLVCDLKQIAAQVVSKLPRPSVRILPPTEDSNG